MSDDECCLGFDQLVGFRNRKTIQPLQHMNAASCEHKLRNLNAQRLASPHHLDAVTSNAFVFRITHKQRRESGKTAVQKRILLSVQQQRILIALGLELSRRESSVHLERRLVNQAVRVPVVRVRLSVARNVPTRQQAKNGRVFCSRRNSACWRRRPSNAKQQVQVVHVHVRHGAAAVDRRSARRS